MGEKTADQLMVEIHEQPEVIEGLLRSERGHVQEIAARLCEYEPAWVLIAARGTSDNAARYAQYLWGNQHRLPVSLATPSLYTLYETPPTLRNTLVVGVSQSGQSPDIVSVVANAHEQGMPTLAITNAPDSPLAEASEHVLDIRAGTEKCVAATKTYTAELAAIAMLSACWQEDDAAWQALEKVPEAAAQCLKANAGLADTIGGFEDIADAAVVGRGYNFCTAFEVALKINELTYVGANAFSSADLMHGPVAMASDGFPVILAAPSGVVSPEMTRLAASLGSQGARLLVVSDQDALLQQADVAMPLPAGLPEWLSPLVAVMPGQLFAHHLAVARGLDPINPRGLNKVTETR